MRFATLLVALSLLPSSAIPSFSKSPVSSSYGGKSTAASSFSVDDFDWREMAPALFAASTLPGEAGIKAILENSKVLRSYIAAEVRIDCRPGNDRCDSSREGFSAKAEITKRIDGIVREGIVHRHRTSFLEYSMKEGSFPFSGVAAIRSDKPGDAYFILQLADHSYTAADLQAKYGAPYDTDIAQWYSVFKYRLNGDGYTSKAVFEVDPRDGAVLKVAISLKARKRR